MKTAVMIMAAILLLTASCLKTREKLITPFELCEDKKKLADDEDYRDPYDNCLMVQEEYVKSESGCLKLCKDFCTRQDENYHDMWVDFSGCHCFCQRSLSK